MTDFDNLEGEAMKAKADEVAEKAEQAIEMNESAQEEVKAEQAAPQPELQFQSQPQAQPQPQPQQPQPQAQPGTYSYSYQPPQPAQSTPVQPNPYQAVNQSNQYTAGSSQPNQYGAGNSDSSQQPGSYNQPQSGYSQPQQSGYTPPQQPYEPYGQQGYGYQQNSPYGQQYNQYGYQQKSKLVAGLLGIFLGGFGVHNFYLGFTTKAVIQIVVTVCTCGAGSIWGFIEGILYLCGNMNVDANGVVLKD